jgi:pteridine reductase
LKSQFFLTQAVAKTMKQGVILNLADVNGERPMRNFTPYTCSKAGLLMMTRNLAKEWAPKIRVNSISPGAVLLPESYTEEQKQKSIDRSLLKRLGSPDDVAEGALFLIANDYITGFDLKVDGGRSLA